MAGMSPSTTSTDTAPAKSKGSIHTRDINAPEDRNLVRVIDPRGSSLEAIYSEILLPKQKFTPPQWVVWGIRYRGWTIERARIGGDPK